MDFSQSAVFFSLFPICNFAFINIRLYRIPHSKLLSSTVISYPFPLTRSIPLSLTFPRPQFRLPNSYLFYGDMFFGLLPNPQPRGPVHRIYKPQGRVAQLYARQRVPILVTFYNLHGLQWDYSFPQSPHMDFHTFIYIYIRCVTWNTWVTQMHSGCRKKPHLCLHNLYLWEFQHSRWNHAFSPTPFMWNIKLISFYCNPHACFHLQKFSKFGIQNNHFFIFGAVTCLTAVVTFQRYPTCYTMLHIYVR